MQPETTHIDYSKSHGFSNIFLPYTFPSVPEPRLADSQRLQDLVVDGKLVLSLDDAIALALENNGGIAVARYDCPLPKPTCCVQKGEGRHAGSRAPISRPRSFPAVWEEAWAVVRPQAEAVRAASWEEVSIASARRVAVIQE